jgi:tetratricopeptide (TPR) repeat protein
MPIFLHIGWEHLLGNMIPVILFGPMLEEMYGYGGFATIYVGSGIAGALVSMYHGHGAPAAGASGAVFGMMIAILVAGLLHRDRLPYRLARVFRRPQFTILLALYVAYQLFSGYMSPNIDNWGHVGGLAGGALLAALIPPPWGRCPDVAISGTRNGVSQSDLITAGPGAIAEGLAHPTRGFEHRAGDGLTTQGDSGPEIRIPPADWASARAAESVWRNPNRGNAQAIGLIPLSLVVLAAAATAYHYPKAHRVSTLLTEGASLLEKGQAADAAVRFEQAQRLASEDDRPYDELGQLSLEGNRPAEARADFAHAVKLNPDSFQAQVGLAEAEQLAGDSAAAERTWETVAGRYPKIVEAQVALGDLFAKDKRYQEATNKYLAALRLNPNLAIAHNNLAWLYATADDPQYRNPASALDHARKAVQLTGQREPNYIDTLAEALYVNHRFADAVQAETATLRLDPGNAEFQSHMERYRKAAGI